MALRPLGDSVPDDSGPARHSPSAHRNAGPITSVLRSALPRVGLVLEVASGTGEHAVRFARAFPSLEWQPTDPDGDALASIAAHAETSALPNLRPPLRLDVRERPWPVRDADALVCINMIHISPWEATEALMKGAAAVLPSRAPLVLYGPFRRTGVETAPGNVAFDEDLRRRHPAWGLRDLEAVVEEAGRNGLELSETVEMPANNLSVVLART